MSEEEAQLRRFLALHLAPSVQGFHLIEQVKAYADLKSGPSGDCLEDLLMAKVPLDLDISKLSEDQKDAWAKLKAWVRTDQPYFLLKGYAGAGKTFLLRMLTKDPSTEAKTYIFTAPTNKAKKVLAASLGVNASTTYSALGLKMSDSDDGTLVMDFGSSSKPYIPRGSILVVDEGSYVSKELMDFIEEARVQNGFKVLYVGDPAQLPPVKETSSKVWKLTDDAACKAMLRQVMRFDNQILALSVKIRKRLKDKVYLSPVESDHDSKGGVYVLSSKNRFEQAILKGVEAPADLKGRKVIAWRNKTVDIYNSLIRSHLGFEDRFCVGDQLMLAEPVEFNGNIVASVDDDVTVKSVTQGTVKHLETGVVVPVWSLVVEGDANLTLKIPIDDSEVQAILSNLAEFAKREKGYSRKAAWAQFWRFKRTFHKVRYGAAITAHRSQGSTYENVFVDQMDILANSDKRTAFKCLYVAFTRPTTRVFTY